MRALFREMTYDNVVPNTFVCFFCSGTRERRCPSTIALGIDSEMAASWYRLCLYISF